MKVAEIFCYEIEPSVPRTEIRHIHLLAGLMCLSSPTWTEELECPEFFLHKSSNVEKKHIFIRKSLKIRQVSHAIVGNVIKNFLAHQYPPPPNFIIQLPTFSDLNICDYSNRNFLINFKAEESKTGWFDFALFSKFENN